MEATEFFILARKVAERQATPQERHQLERVLQAHPELKAEFDEIKREAGWKPVSAKDQGELTPPETDDDDDDAARERAAEEEEREFKRRKRAFNWRKWLKFASIAAALTILFWPDFSPPPPRAVITIGIVRGTNAPPEVLAVETSLIKRAWPGVTLTDASDSKGIKAWENDWPESAPDRPIVKIVYDRPANEVRVSGLNGRETFQHTFAVAKGLAEALKEVDAFLTNELH